MITLVNPRPLRVLSLFDYTGNALRPFALRGATCLAVDEQHPEFYHKDAIGITYAKRNLWKKSVLTELMEWRPDLILSFPPCTDLAVSGAAHWASKRERNPLFQEEAMDLAKTAPIISDLCLEHQGVGVPWMVENPVGALSTLWRKPDLIFHPYEFGGYLPEDDEHPRYPEYYPPRDNYTKKTCLWFGRGFSTPEKRPIALNQKTYAATHLKLGGKSLRTKNIRSETPRGFSEALASHYTKLHLRNKLEGAAFAA